MNTIKHFLLMTCLSAGLPTLAADPAPGFPTNEAPNAPVTTIQTSPGQPPPVPTEAPQAATPAQVADLVTNAVAETKALTGTNAIAAAGPAVPPVVVENGTNGLRLNFHNAPLNLVLDYLSDAAGFVINKESDVRGPVDIQGKGLTKDEAVEVLNSALKKNGYAIVRNGRILNIVTQDRSEEHTSELQS